MRIRLVLAAITLFFCHVSLSYAGFLQFPLHGCADAACSVNYTTHSAYTLNAINTVLDHSMAINPTNNYYPYGPTATSTSGGDGKITAFNGESVSGTRLSTDYTCIGGSIYIRPDWNPSGRMTNDSGCGSGYSSYDEHPGYDYKADTGKPVYAAASGYVVTNRCYLGNMGYTCAGWGAVGIDHGNGYISQYFHMNPSSITVTAGTYVSAGTQIGTVSNTCPTPGCAATPLVHHLHFEVRETTHAIGPETYPIVDPYGWVGGGTDPLYSASVVAPANLWQ